MTASQVGFPGIALSSLTDSGSGLLINGPGAPSGGTGADGDMYIDTVGHLLYGPKTTGAWGSGVPIDGADGANAVMYRASTTSVALGVGSKTLGYTAATNLSWTIGTRLRVAYDDTNFMDGEVTAVSSTSVTIDSDYFEGSGTYASWGIAIIGPVGPTGADGTDGNTVTAGTSAPSGGADNDLYIYVGPNELYIKLAGVWTFYAPMGSNGNDGADGADGNDGADGKTIVSGTVPPTTEGNDGDIYIDTVAKMFYGPKTAGAWGTGNALVAVDGADGNDGADGVDFPAASIITKTGAYTLTNTEFAGNVTIKCNSGSAFALTLNTGLTGVEPCHVLQYGTGQITISGSATLRYAVGPKTRGQYSMLSILPLGSDEYVIVGDCAA